MKKVCTVSLQPRLIIVSFFCFWLQANHPAAAADAVTAASGGDEEPFCQVPDFHCDDSSICPCIPDTFAVTFRQGDKNIGSTFEYDVFQAEEHISVAVIAEVKSEKVQAFSYGVKHDARFLTLVQNSVTTMGTMVDPRTEGSPFMGGFNDTKAVPGGWISAVVLSFTEGTQLSLGPNLLALAEYSFTGNPGIRGTSIRFAHKELGPPSSRLTSVEMTVDTKFSYPNSLVHGIVRQKVTLFHRGDSDNDGKISISDATYLLAYAFFDGPSPNCMDSADANGDHRVDIADGIYILNFLFLDGPRPPAPGPPQADCGVGPSSPVGDLGCAAYSACNP